MPLSTGIYEGLLTALNQKRQERRDQFDRAMALAQWQISKQQLAWNMQQQLRREQEEEARSRFEAALALREQQFAQNLQALEARKQALLFAPEAQRAHAEASAATSQAQMLQAQLPYAQKEAQLDYDKAQTELKPFRRSLTCISSKTRRS
jgi:uncharacterized protein (DUF1684 family)